DATLDDALDVHVALAAELARVGHGPVHLVAAVVRVALARARVARGAVPGRPGHPAVVRRVVVAERQGPVDRTRPDELTWHETHRSRGGIDHHVARDGDGRPGRALEGLTCAARRR